MVKTYSDKLKDPRWQKKRLNILNRDEFKCRSCGSLEKTLHVHHLKYNAEPWDAGNDDLVTLCEECHSVATYLDYACNKLNIGWEHIYSIVNLFQKIEWNSIDNFLKEQDKV